MFSWLLQVAGFVLVLLWWLSQNWGTCLSLTELSLGYHLQKVTRFSTDSCYNLVKGSISSDCQYGHWQIHRGFRAVEAVNCVASAHDEAGAWHAPWVSFNLARNSFSHLLRFSYNWEMVLPSSMVQTAFGALPQTQSEIQLKTAASVALIKWNKIHESFSFHMPCRYYSFSSIWNENRNVKRNCFTYILVINSWNTHNLFCGTLFAIE